MRGTEGVHYSPVPIEEGEGTAESWSGDTQGDGGSHHFPPGVLNSEEHRAESKVINYLG